MPSARPRFSGGASAHSRRVGAGAVGALADADQRAEEQQHRVRRRQRRADGRDRPDEDAGEDHLARPDAVGDRSRHQRRDREHQQVHRREQPELREVDSSNVLADERRHAVHDLAVEVVEEVDQRQQRQRRDAARPLRGRGRRAERRRERRAACPCPTTRRAARPSSQALEAGDRFGLGPVAFVDEVVAHVSAGVDHEALGILLRAEALGHVLGQCRAARPSSSP